MGATGKLSQGPVLMFMPDADSCWVLLMTQLQPTAHVWGMLESSTRGWNCAKESSLTAKGRGLWNTLLHRCNRPRNHCSILEVLHDRPGRGVTFVPQQTVLRQQGVPMGRRTRPLPSLMSMSLHSWLLSIPIMMETATDEEILDLTLGSSVANKNNLLLAIAYFISCH